MNLFSNNHVSNGILLLVFKLERFTFHCYSGYPVLPATAFYLSMDNDVKATF